MRVRAQRIDRAERVVLRMRSGQHRAVWCDQPDALVVQVFVGHDVEVEALRLQPGQQMQVGRIVPHSRPTRIIEREKSRTHRQDRPMTRRERNAAVVAMLVVGGTAVGRIIDRIVRIGSPRSDPFVIGLIDAGARVVGIGLIGEGRGQERDRCKRPLLLRQNIERQPIFTRIAGEMQRIGAAAQIVGYCPGEIRLPAAVSQVVVVKVDGAIVMRCVTPALLATAPARADHGARRHIHQVPVARLRADVMDRLTIDPKREIPAGMQLPAKARAASHPDPARK